MTSATLVLAHAGEGATWQALLTLLSLGLVAVLVLVLAGVLSVREPGDLILPLAGTAVLASLSGATSSVLSDWVGWAFPIGVTALVALVLAALSPLELGLASPLTIGTVGVAAVAALLLQGPIVRAWHPVQLVLDSAPLDDLAVEIVEPEADTTLPVGDTELVVRTTGGTIGAGEVPTGQAPADPEEQVLLTVTVVSLDTGQNTSFVASPADDCTDGCEQVTIPVTFEEPGSWSVFVEARTADSRTFTRVPASTGTTSTSVDVTIE